MCAAIKSAKYIFFVVITSIFALTCANTIKLDFCEHLLNQLLLHLYICMYVLREYECVYRDVVECSLSSRTVEAPTQLISTYLYKLQANCI